MRQKDISAKVRSWQFIHTLKDSMKHIYFLKLDFTFWWATDFILGDIRVVAIWYCFSERQFSGDTLEDFIRCCIQVFVQYQHFKRRLHWFDCGFLILIFSWKKLTLFESLFGVTHFFNFLPVVVAFALLCKISMFYK